MAAPVAIEVHELARMLDQRVSSLAPELLPNGVRRGPFWRASGLDDNGTSESLAVNLTGQLGFWTDFAVAKGARERSGDMLKLVALLKFGGDLKNAIAWAISYLGLDGLDPGRLRTMRAAAVEKAKRDDADAQRKTERMRRIAQGIWIGAQPLLGSPAELYLMTRGIDLSLLDRVTEALRYHPAVYCDEAKRDLPALVAAIVALDGTHVATHRIWIEDDGRGGARKHSGLAEPKKAIGSWWGAHLPLNKGASPATLRDIPAGSDVAISEGIEDGLTVACACPQLRVVAGVTLGNIGAMLLPPQIGSVTIVAQNDAPGSAAEATLQKVIAQHQAQGRIVRRALPPEGVKDANDLARGIHEPKREEAA